MEKSLPADYLPARHQHPLFIKKLMEENSWSLAFATEAVQEYLKFLNIVLNYGPKQTPSKVVDEVWHLHLQFTKDYWEYLCPTLLGFNLHHIPAESSSKAETEIQFKKTLTNYKSLFGHVPTELWTGQKRNSIVKTENKITPYLLVALVLMMIGAPSFKFLPEVSGPEFLVAYGSAGLFLSMMILVLKQLMPGGENTIRDAILFIAWIAFALVGGARFLHGVSNGYPVFFLVLEMIFLGFVLPAVCYFNTDDNGVFQGNVADGSSLFSSRSDSSTSSSSCGGSSCSTSSSCGGGGCGGCGGGD